MSPSEFLHLEIVLDDRSSIEAAENTDQEVKDDFKIVPVPIVRNLEQDQLARSEWVHEGESHCRCQRAKETSPHGRRGKVVGHFLREEPMLGAEGRDPAAAARTHLE